MNMGEPGEPMGEPGEPCHPRLQTELAMDTAARLHGNIDALEGKVQVQVQVALRQVRHHVEVHVALILHEFFVTRC